MTFKTTSNIIINDLNFRTSVLESLDWDELVCNDFFIYLEQSLENNLSIEELFSDIISLYNKNLAIIIKDVFEEVYYNYSEEKS